ncbi:MAG: hypothetical protein LBM92_03075, partial [Opitutaceae bacterium]|nr:hypothetical protein [Opitutaceae bacterium]
MKLIPLLKIAGLGALLASGVLNSAAPAKSDAAAFAGSRWALTLPGGGAGWLGLSQNEDGKLDA